MARRSFSVFSLSFLDVMACGLGATILMLMIISAQVRVKADLANDSLRAEARLVEQEVLDARKNLLRLKDTTAARDNRATGAAAEIERLQKLIAELRVEADKQDNDSLAKKESAEQLRADVQRLEEGMRRLAEAQPEAGTGEQIRSFVGAGNRQYLTGMRMGGQRVLILVDASSSMLGRTYANVVRYRAMPDGRKVQAPKWRQTLAIVDWLTTQIQPGARFQIYTFNEQAGTTVAGSNGDWIEARDGNDFDAALAGLRKVVPSKGTSLLRAFAGRPQPAADARQHLPDHRRPADPGRHRARRSRAHPGRPARKLPAPGRR